ncbi:MAG: hypothetical protein Q8Q56_00670 [Alphaproteobacteria bacterium]|nr:hypothetical protein [Alphaproteobacteria bacterium]
MKRYFLFLLSVCCLQCLTGSEAATIAERAASDGIPCVRERGYIIPAGKVHELPAESYDLTAGVARLSLDERDKDRTALVSLRKKQSVEMPLEVPFLKFFTTEGFMALHEIPLIWQRYLRKHYNDSLPLKRVLLVSGVDFIKDADLTLEGLIASIHPERSADDSFYERLIELLSTPFAWNNIDVRRVLRSVYSLVRDVEALKEKLAGFNIKDEVLSVVHLNMGFLAKGMKDKEVRDHYFNLLAGNRITLGLLERDRCSRDSLEDRTRGYPEKAKGYAYFQEAVRRRYGLDGSQRNLKSAHRYYQESLARVHLHPGIIMDGVSFYKTLLESATHLPSILAQLEMTQEQLQTYFLHACWQGMRIKHIPAILEGVHYLEKHSDYVLSQDITPVDQWNDLRIFFRQSHKERLREAYQRLFFLTEDDQFDRRFKELGSV